MARALLMLAPGFEEIEAIVVLDVLRRAKIEVVTASLDQHLVRGAHDLQVIADALLSEVEETLFDAVVLPGGEPGTTHLAASQAVKNCLQNHHKAQKWVAAICAAPRILESLGILQGKKATSFPGTRPKLVSCEYVEVPVVVDGNVITSRGVGTALPFALELVRVLQSDTVAQNLSERMVCTA
ncbi:MAG: DJ-1 family glyoxalase III [Candidatus Margulisiibacteriota bacterium]